MSRRNKSTEEIVPFGPHEGQVGHASDDCPIGRPGLLLKGIEDKILSIVLLLLMLPLMLIIAVSIRLDSPGPVLFRQRRHHAARPRAEAVDDARVCQEARAAARVEPRADEHINRQTRPGP